MIRWIFIVFCLFFRNILVRSHGTITVAVHKIASWTHHGYLISVSVKRKCTYEHTEVKSQNLNILSQRSSVGTRKLEFRVACWSGVFYGYSTHKPEFGVCLQLSYDNVLHINITVVLLYWCLVQDPSCNVKAVSVLQSKAVMHRITTFIINFTLTLCCNLPS